MRRWADEECREQQRKRFPRKEAGQEGGAGEAGGNRGKRKGMWRHGGDDGPVNQRKKGGEVKKDARSLEGGKTFEG